MGLWFDDHTRSLSLDFTILDALAGAVSLSRPLALPFSCKQRALSPLSIGLSRSSPDPFSERAGGAPQTSYRCSFKKESRLQAKASGPVGSPTPCCHRGGPRCACACVVCGVMWASVSVVRGVCDHVRCSSSAFVARCPRGVKNPHLGAFRVKITKQPVIRDRGNLTLLRLMALLGNARRLGFRVRCDVCVWGVRGCGCGCVVRGVSCAAGDAVDDSLSDVLPLPLCCVPVVVLPYLVQYQAAFVILSDHLNRERRGVADEVARKSAVPVIPEHLRA